MISSSTQLFRAPPHRTSTTVWRGYVRPSLPSHHDSSPVQTEFEAHMPCLPFSTSSGLLSPSPLLTGLGGRWDIPLGPSPFLLSPYYLPLAPWLPMPAWPASTDGGSNSGLPGQICIALQCFPLVECASLLASPIPATAAPAHSSPMNAKPRAQWLARYAHVSPAQVPGHPRNIGFAALGYLGGPTGRRTQLCRSPYGLSPPVAIGTPQTLRR